MKGFINPNVTLNFFSIPYYKEKFGHNKVKAELLQINVNSGTCRARIQSFDGEPLGVIDISLSYIEEDTITLNRG